MSKIYHGLEGDKASANIEKCIQIESETSLPGAPATEQEMRDLYHDVGDIPSGVWLAALVASAERFAWYGATGPLRMYIANRPSLTKAKISMTLRVNGRQRTICSMIAIVEFRGLLALSKRPLLSL